eukprot:CAMPEP_0119502364 /NCGR_PEP_ID=MMETSP1344-20130328/23858_1 /TAXON_ID=236787 /ORGANISM="Florenciella parvula, Strain CCMP2471" /LENGTH=57 /DNA_ID=CAMNT_0007538565 /DNA_START=250 /DNA_END=420 /DNA_ORIENTATION=-
MRPGLVERAARSRLPVYHRRSESGYWYQPPLVLNVAASYRFSPFTLKPWRTETCIPG